VALKQVNPPFSFPSISSRSNFVDLKLQGQEFATLLSILYVGYITMQVPSNMFLDRIGKPSLYLPTCIIIWGVISCLTGITTNFVGALLTRFFLGFFEAAFLPGALYLLSKWYTKKELGLRNAILFCGNLLSNAFGGLLAVGILDGMQDKLGHAAWRWCDSHPSRHGRVARLTSLEWFIRLFYIEGALTVAVAIAALFILPDFPSTTSWLSSDERRLAELRMAEDAGVGDEENKRGSLTRGLAMALKDWKVWWMGKLSPFVSCRVAF